MTTLIDKELINNALDKANISALSRAGIRELVSLVNQLEAESGQRFIRMEMGVPGLEAPSIGIEAEIKALKSGVASKYPMIEGVSSLKHEISRFCKAFLNIQVDQAGCFPTVGSAQGALASFVVANRLRENGKTLFIDPGFPNQKRQLTMLGQQWGSFDVYEHRGDALEEALEKHLSSGEYTTLLYSNPNNPAWICFDEKELQIIAKVTKRYDVIVIEDLAYFGMDYRKDYAKPFQAPFQPSIAHYTDQYILLISSSKVFSYAGQRVGCLVISDALFARECPTLKPSLGQTLFGKAITLGALHNFSSGVTHSAQYGLAAMLKAASDGELPFLQITKIYKDRAQKMKRMFLENGFKLVYENDNGESLSDGFYFTLSHPDMDGDTLMKTLLCFGISAISLANTGSEHTDGIRACVSQVRDEQLEDLAARLKALHDSFKH